MYRDHISRETWSEDVVRLFLEQVMEASYFRPVKNIRRVFRRTGLYVVSFTSKGRLFSWYGWMPRLRYLVVRAVPQYLWPSVLLACTYPVVYSAQKMEAAALFETLVPTYQSTRRQLRTQHYEFHSFSGWYCLGHDEPRALVVVMVVAVAVLEASFFLFYPFHLFIFFPSFRAKTSYACCNRMVCLALLFH